MITRIYLHGGTELVLEGDFKLTEVVLGRNGSYEKTACMIDGTDTRGNEVEIMMSAVAAVVGEAEL